MPEGSGGKSSRPFQYLTGFLYPEIECNTREVFCYAFGDRHWKYQHCNGRL